MDNGWICDLDSLVRTNMDRWTLPTRLSVLVPESRDPLYTYKKCQEEELDFTWDGVHEMTGMRLHEIHTFDCRQWRTRTSSPTLYCSSCTLHPGPCDVQSAWLYLGCACKSNSLLVWTEMLGLQNRHFQLERIGIHSYITRSTLILVFQWNILEPWTPFTHHTHSS